MIPKFRAWDKETQTMNGMAEIYRNKNQEIELHPRDENIILMQSTGLKDKNGKEIFEGDVVQFEDCYTESDFLYINKGIVEWSQGSFTVTNRDSVEMEDLLDGEILDVIIIGNIHENPELLEVGD
jgi:uncharacterized phage protein (TIGR01671 family)